MGGFVNCLMGFILPPLIHIKVSSGAHRGGCGGWAPAGVHWAIVLFGAAALVVSTTLTIEDIASR